jgi:hypothetical protein
LRGLFGLGQDDFVIPLKLGVSSLERFPDHLPQSFAAEHAAFLENQNRFSLTLCQFFVDVRPARA